MLLYDVAMTYNNIGLLYENQSKYKEALEYYNKALPIRMNKLGKDHRDTKQTLRQIQRCKNQLGM